MFLFVGLLCAGIVSTGLMASEVETHKFTALTHLTSKQSQNILSKLRAIHPRLADHCNQESSFKDKNKCDDILKRLNRGESQVIDRENRSDTGAYRLFTDLKITANPEFCTAKYQDPIDCDTCITAAEQKLSTAQSTFDKEIQNQKFKS